MVGWFDGWTVGGRMDGSVGEWLDDGWMDGTLHVLHDDRTRNMALGSARSRLAYLLGLGVGSVINSWFICSRFSL